MDVTLELAVGIEPTTSSLPRMRSTPELRELCCFVSAFLKPDKNTASCPNEWTGRGTPDKIWGRRAELNQLHGYVKKNIKEKKKSLKLLRIGCLDGAGCGFFHRLRQQQ